MCRWLAGAAVTMLVLFMACGSASGDWQVSFDMGDSTDHTSSVRQTSDGGYILMGSLWHVSTPGEWPVVELIKTDEHGAEEWTREIDYIRAGPCVQQTGDDGYVVAGRAYPPGGGRSNGYMRGKDRRRRQRAGKEEL